MGEFGLLMDYLVHALYDIFSNSRYGQFTETSGCP